MRHTGILRGLSVVALGLVLSCSSDSTTAPRTPPTVLLTVTPVQGKPGGSLTATISATPASASDGVAVVTIAATGLVTSTDSLVGTISGSGLTFSRVLALPLDHGTVQLVATARAQSGATARTETAVTVADPTPPTISNVSVSPAAGAVLQPSDSLRVSYYAADDIALRYMLVRVTGAMTAVDSVAFAGVQTYASRTARFVVPRSVTLGTTAQVVVEAMDAGGNVTRFSAGNFSVQDQTPPAVAATLSGANANGGYAPGGQLTLAFTASDNVALARVGYSLGTPVVVQDSFVAAGATFQKTVTVALASTLNGSYPLTLFAVDSAGQRTSLIAGIVTVASRARRAIVSAPVAGVRDLAYDAKRARIYASQPDSNAVAVFSLPDGTRLGSLSMPGNPRGIDLSLGSDSLVAALYGTSYIGLYNLVTGRMDTVRLNGDAFFGQRPDNLRVMANNRAVVTFTFAGSGYGGKVMEFDLRTNTAGGSVTVTERTPVARSMNRQRAYFLIDDSCCPEAAFSYDATTGRFSGQRGTVSYYFPSTSADFSGATYMAGNSLFGSDLNVLRTVPVAMQGPNVLSPDATYVYAATSSGVSKLRSLDGSTVESFTLGAAPTNLLMLPDGLTLIATTSKNLYVIDLW